jgi:pimeloyl-ACP methyl ester carboxylesterase
MECELRDIGIHYEVRGEGRPIIMLHGWSLDHQHLLGSMEPVFKGRKGWKRIYPDLPGHGRTPGKAWIRNQDGILKVVLDFIEGVIPGKRLVVAGASAGAYLARGVAYHKAAVMDGLLLTVPMVVADDAKRIVPAHVTLVQDPALAAVLTQEQAEVFNDMVVVQNRKTYGEVTAPPPAPKEAGDADFQAGIRNDPKRYGFSFDVDAVRELFPAPVLIIAGRQDSVVGYRQAWEMLENYPRGTFAVLDRAGHFLEVEQDELYADLVGEWLDRVEEYAP